MKKVLIIGAGGIGKRHIRGFLKTGRAALSIAEPDAAKRDEALAAYPIARGYADAGEADLSAFDLAVIAAPAHVHVPLALRCADAGLPFLTEKPLAVTLDGVDELIARVRARGIEARVGYVRRSSPETIELRRRVQAGEIGKVRMAYANASQEFPKYRPDYQRTYYAKAAMGGGCILDGASHMIDLLLWTVGEPVEVSAMYDRLALEGVEAEDCCLITIRFRNGALAQIAMNQFQKPNTNTFELIGETGNLMMDVAILKLARDDSGQWESRDFMAGLKPLEAHEARFALQANLMLDAVAGKPCHLATLEEARTNLRVALAAKQADKEKRIISLG